jgi:hypothetical protein
MVCGLLPLSLLPHEGLLHLQLLLLAHLHHHLLHASVHLLLVVLLAAAFAVDPGVLHHCVEGKAFFGIGVEHLLYQICIMIDATFELSTGW